MSLEPSFDAWSVIFSAVILHGFVLSQIFFFRKKGKRSTNRLLGVILFLFSLHILSYLAFWTRYNLQFPHMRALSATFSFLYGPLLFLYVLSILRTDKKWKKWELLHFLPFLVYLIYLSPIYFQTGAQKAAVLREVMQQITQSPTSFEFSGGELLAEALKSLHMGIYAGLIFNLKRFNGFFNIQFQRISLKKNQWINIIKYCFLGFILSNLLFYVLVQAIGYGLEYDYIISFAMSVFIFTIGYIGFIRPEFLHEAHNGSKYENSSLEELKANQYVEHLLSYMEEEKPFINGDLKLEDLSKDLEIPRHHLSQIINERLRKNFFEFINSYRVEEAKKILCDPKKQDYIILRVALESGFNNKTSFNTAFKNEVGLTPSEFRKKKGNGKISDH